MIKTQNGKGGRAHIISPLSLAPCHPPTVTKTSSPRIYTLSPPTRCTARSLSSIFPFSPFTRARTNDVIHRARCDYRRARTPSTENQLLAVPSRTRNPVYTLVTAAVVHIYYYVLRISGERQQHTIAPHRVIRPYHHCRRITTYNNIICIYV